MPFEPVIGLEIHAQLRTDTKIFCSCTTRFGAPPNSNVCAVCLGLPGALPVLNDRAVEYAVRAGLALGCRISERSVFARKNYFYPDLPKGYQISQYELPLASDGLLEYEAAGAVRHVGIVRVHLEEDAGKSLHEGFPDSHRHTYLDFNRAGVPLIEIVTRPDLRSAAEAAAFFERLRAILVALEVNDGNMEEGSLRCDANVSVRPAGSDRLGVKVEVKNLNSFRYLQKALEHEIDRQIGVLEEGGRIAQETRLWDVGSGRTVIMRSKEDAHDYRYFPEPDLPPLAIGADRVEEIQRRLPELPDARKRRLLATHGLPEYDAALLSQSRALAAYFEEVVAAGAGAKMASNWIMGELTRKLKALGVEIDQVSLPPARLAALIRLVQSGSLSGAMAKVVFDKMYDSGRTAEDIVAEEGLAQIDDEQALAAAVRDVLARHPEPVAAYRAGKSATLGFLVGQVMKATGGKANPARVNALLKRELGG
jgi:aspartyl-tRNA(Asn)/glutamyl-tRNA(Gln) amidotransferase subunit B